MSPTIVRESSNFLMILIDAAGRSLLLGCLVAAALAAFRVKSVGIRLLAWRGVLLIALAMPLLVALGPRISVDLPLPYLSQSHDVPTVDPGPAPSQLSTAPPLDIESARHAAETAQADDAIISAASTSTKAPADSQSYWMVVWPVLAAGAYLLVAFGLLLRVLIGVRIGQRLEAAAAMIDDSRALGLLSAAGGSAGLKVFPRLVESDRLSVPLMLGVRRPAILLPAGWRHWGDEEFAAVLAHELSHVQRRDALVQRLALIHRAAFWFSPFAWWLDRHLADLSEQASDEAALASGADRTRYAETLLGFFAELEAAPQRVWWYGVAMAKIGQAERRVERILAWNRTMPSKLTKAFVGGLAVCAVPLIALTATLHPSFYALPRLALPQAPAPASPPPDDVVIAPNPVPEPHPVIVRPPKLTADGAPAPPVVAVAPLEPGQQMAAPIATLALPSPPLQQPAPPAPLAAQVPATPVAPPAPPTPSADWDNWNWPADLYWPWGPRFAIVTHGSSSASMASSQEDAEHADSLRSKISGDFLWFEHEGKSYIVRDPATIDRAKQIWAHRNTDSQQREELQRKEEELGKQMREQVQQKIQDVRVKIPDLSAQLEKLQAEVKSLNASGATLQELGDLQRQVGELQQALGESRWESGVQMNELGRRAGELGQQMGDLGRQIGELARQQVEQRRQAGEQMQQLFDSAIANGTAKPE